MFFNEVNTVYILVMDESFVQGTESTKLKPRRKMIAAINHYMENPHYVGNPRQLKKSSYMFT